ncbi:hypothetical protein BKA62DRAFT_760909, partial [Auriculariales sp. MPI-PUGE-AT-0066]
MGAKYGLLLATDLLYAERKPWRAGYDRRGKGGKRGGPFKSRNAIEHARMRLMVVTSEIIPGNWVKIAHQQEKVKCESRRGGRGGGNAKHGHLGLRRSRGGGTDMARDDGNEALDKDHDRAVWHVSVAGAAAAAAVDVEVEAALSEVKAASEVEVAAEVKVVVEALWHRQRRGHRGQTSTGTAHRRLPSADPPNPKTIDKEATVPSLIHLLLEGHECDSERMATTLSCSVRTGRSMTDKTLQLYLIYKYTRLLQRYVPVVCGNSLMSTSAVLPSAAWGLEMKAGGSTGPLAAHKYLTSTEPAPTGINGAQSSQRPGSYTLLLILFAYVAAHLVKTFARYAAGSGISEIKCMLCYARVPGSDNIGNQEPYPSEAAFQPLTIVSGLEEILLDVFKILYFDVAILLNKIGWFRIASGATYWADAASIRCKPVATALACLCRPVGPCDAECDACTLPRVPGVFARPPSFPGSCNLEGFYTTSRIIHERVASKPGGILYDYWQKRLCAGWRRPRDAHQQKNGKLSTTDLFATRAAATRLSSNGTADDMQRPACRPLSRPAIIFAVDEAGGESLKRAPSAASGCAGGRAGDSEVLAVGWSFGHGSAPGQDFSVVTRCCRPASWSSQAVPLTTTVFFRAGAQRMEIEIARMPATDLYPTYLAQTARSILVKPHIKVTVNSFIRRAQSVALDHNISWVKIKCLPELKSSNLRVTTGEQETQKSAGTVRQWPLIHWGSFGPGSAPGGDFKKSKILPDYRASVVLNNANTTGTTPWQELVSTGEYESVGSSDNGQSQMLHYLLEHLRYRPELREGFAILRLKSGSLRFASANACSIFVTTDCTARTFADALIAYVVLVYDALHRRNSTIELIHRPTPIVSTVPLQSSRSSRYNRRNHPTPTISTRPSRPHQSSAAHAGDDKLPGLARMEHAWMDDTHIPQSPITLTIPKSRVDSAVS